MEVEVGHPGELGPTEVRLWKGLQSQSRQLETPFGSSTFARAVGTVDGRARVAFAWEGGELVAVLPFVRGRFGAGRPLAAGVASCHAVLQAPDALASWDTLLSRCGLTAWRFDNLVALDQPPQSGTPVATNVVDLTDGFEPYLDAAAKRTKRFFNDLRRKEQRLVRDLGAISFTSGTVDRVALGKLLEWKSMQYRRSGWPDPFSKAWVRSLIELLLDADEPDCTGRMSVLRAGDEIVAVDFSLHSRSVYGGWFVAYNPEFPQYSAGNLRWIRLLQALASEGVSLVDLGPGDQDYKRRLRTGTEHLYRGVVTRPCLRSSLYRAADAARHRSRAFVVEHPSLRKSVKRSLRVAGQLRTRLAPHSPELAGATVSATERTSPMPAEIGAAP